MKVSDKIKQRIAEAKYFSNDNIAEFIEEGELEELVKEVQNNFEEVLQALVIDTANDHNTKETAHRVAKMFIYETFGGRYKERPRVTSFPNETNYDGIYCTGPISIRSTCAHHFQNIVGHCWVGVKPSTEVIGLSKFNRIIHWIAERPQIQEEMTQQIADELQKAIGTDDIAVVVKAEHHCMTHRGVKEHESDMTTSIMRGAFKEDQLLRNEFYEIIGKMRGMK